MDEPGTTRRFDDQRGLRCLRCGTPMALTRAWAKALTGVVDRDIEVAPAESTPTSWRAWLESVTLRSRTCLQCGYTEFYAEDLPRLRWLLDEAALNDNTRRFADER